MKVLFIRHAEAEDAGHGEAGRDEKRRLTAHGHEQAKVMGKALAALGLTPDVVLTSPLVRARQTAEGVSAAMNLSMPVRETASLAPGGRWENLQREIADIITREKVSGGAKHGPCVFLFGHQPDMGIMIAATVGSEEGVDLQKGATVGVRWRGNGCDSTPEVFIALTQKLARTLAG